MTFAQALARLAARQDLTGDEIAALFGSIMEGKATPAQIGALLMGLRVKGETPEEIAGAARAMRARALGLRCRDPELAVDTCGTGGDGSGTVNVSTMAAFVVAAAGVRVAKHGNRAVSSRAGSADVLEALGIGVLAPISTWEACLDELNLGFLFAPSFHAATRHAAAPRKELGVRTVFNLLGPLTNPAGVGNQLIGVFDPRLCESVARALALLGGRRAFVVSAAKGGLDEIAVAGVTQVAELDRGRVTVRVWTPRDFGLRDEDPAGLAGGDAADNARIVRAVFAGQPGAARSAVLMAAAAALLLAGAVADLPTGVAGAAAVLDEGRATALLDAIVERTKGIAS